MAHFLRMVCLILTLACWANGEEPAIPSTVASGASLVEVFADDRFYEGPTWSPKENKLYFTAFGGKAGSQVMRLESPGKATAWFDKSLGLNGTYLSLDGRLLGAQGNARRIVSIAPGGDAA